MKKRSGIAPLIAIGGILLALSVGSFFLTPDRAFSENENRYLQLTPRLTWDRIMSGDFMEDVEDYTSDQIVFRDFWSAARSVLQRAEGKEDISGTYLGADGRYFAKVTDDSFDWVRLEKNAGYIRDFFADNKGATLKDAIRCWHWKKLQLGSHKYEKSDSVEAPQNSNLS